MSKVNLRYTGNKPPLGLVNSGWSKMAMPKSDHPGIRLRDRLATTRRRAEDVDRLRRRIIRLTLVPVAHGNGLQKFQAARRSYR